MRLTADTNLLVRVVVRDDVDQANAALKLLTGAEHVAISLPCLCEFVWVLERVYRYRSREIVAAIRAIVEVGNVVIDNAAVEIGMKVQLAGGDFADGVIAAAGEALGGETFVSFDRKAVSRVAATGIEARYATAIA